MHHRRFLLLLCLVLAFVFCVPAQGLASNPADYERAKAQLARLHRGKASAQAWLSCAEAFRKVYNNNPRWRLRGAALYRCGVALEGRARVTRSADHARRAVAVYEQAARAHAKTALADDALFRAAVVQNELLRDKRKARLNLQKIARSYPNSDFAAPAKRYLAALDGDSSKTTKAPPKVQAAKAPAPAAKKATPASTKATASKSAAKPVSKPEPKKAVAERKAPVPKGKPIAQNLAAQLGLSVRTVVIDAGHGGRDPGTMHNGVVERDINLDVAKRIKSILEKRGYTVQLTREGNKWLSLGERVRLGKRFKGDLFVSIHVNAAESSSAVGFETYILDFARTSSASRLAVIENANSGRLGDMDKVLGEIVRGVRTAESRRLADCIQNSTVSHLKKSGRKLHDGGVKGAPFFVLVGSSMPSVLVEVGYCSNKTEARRLLDPKHRQALAQGISNGVHAYARGLSGR
ncbi:N-acetylmuramoyl-L-alanine amidase [Mailhella sp.]|uniref:N-acetylmuramoyl-L-alanine amidase n=1 Tax=Mailhella sp. TaxID=1981029 RepID=UPI0040647486